MAQQTGRSRCVGIADDDEPEQAAMLLKLLPSAKQPNEGLVSEEAKAILEIMYSKARGLPEALVLGWNGRSLRVRCPYCARAHGHSFSTKLADATDRARGWQLRATWRQRRSDCRNGGEYLLTLPGTEGSEFANYGWEVDRKRSRLVAVNEDGPVGVPDQTGRSLRAEHQDVEPSIASLEDLTTNTSALDINTPEQKAEDSLREQYSCPKWRRTNYFSLCILGTTPKLAAFCSMYASDHHVGSSDDKGNTGAILAAPEECGLEILKWLHQHGDPIDSENHYGRNALMEAALMGRLKTVQYLVNQGVDTEARDANGMRAVDLAAHTTRNTYEREQRCRIYREPQDADHQREQIVSLLNRHAASISTSPQPRPAVRRQAFFSRRPDGNVEINRPHELLEIPSGRNGKQTQKALATLDRGPGYPHINAMSGWTHKDYPHVMDNNEWTPKAKDLQQYLRLPANQILASHVEPQLLAYLLHRHSLVLLESAEHLQELESVMPPYTLHPTITVSKPDFCNDASGCSVFFQRFKSWLPVFDLTFTFRGDDPAGRVIVQK